MYILGISTINCQGSVALIANDGTLVAESIIKDSSSLSRTLVPTVQSILTEGNVAWNRIEMLAFTSGPGSFTSLRIGLAVIKGFVFGRTLPVVGVSSLESLAAGVNLNKGIVIPLLDAKKGEVYYGIYSVEDGMTKVLQNDCAEKPELVADLVKEKYPEALLLGDGMDKYQATFSGFQQISLKPGVIAYQTALLGMRQGACQKGITLQYCRSSEAEVSQGISLDI